MPTNNPWTPWVKFWLDFEKNAQTCGTLSHFELLTAGPKFTVMALARLWSQQNL